MGAGETASWNTIIGLSSSSIDNRYGMRLRMFEWSHSVGTLSSNTGEDILANSTPHYRSDVLNRNTIALARFHSLPMSHKKWCH